MGSHPFSCRNGLLTRTTGNERLQPLQLIVLTQLDELLRNRPFKAAQCGTYITNKVEQSADHERSARHHLREAAIQHNRRMAAEAIILLAVLNQSPPRAATVGAGHRSMVNAGFLRERSRLPPLRLRPEDDAHVDPAELERRIAADIPKALPSK